MKKLFAVLTLLAIVVVTPAVYAAEDGAAVFKSKCAMCHGPDGAGQTAMGKNLKIKPLGSAEVQKLTDEDLTKIITDGKGKMPAYKTKLSADQIKAVVAFIRTLKK